MKRLAVAILGAALLLSGMGGAPGALAAGAGAQPPAAASNQRIWPDESIYFIMIDRFNNGDRSNDGAVLPGDPRAWHGGDLQGIIDKLDYIKSLGFTAIWITPHVKNAGRDYHGYGAVDFFDTDPHFGTVAKAKELVDKAHAKGIKVLFDIVVNHTGPQNPLVAQHPDWFHPKAAITDWNNEKQVQEGWIFDLPDFDQSKPEVADYIVQYSKFWIEQTGVDGFRLDTVKHVEPGFFTWYNQELQKVKPGFWLIGEMWHSSPYKIAPYQTAGVTALMDFPLQEAANKVFAKDATMSTLAQTVSTVGGAMADPWEMGGFLDNHDMPRFVSEAKDDPIRRLKLGLTFLFTGRDIPILYYGTEIGMPGKNDPYNRADFPWGKEQNKDVQELVTKLNQVRASNLALRRGTVESLLTEQNRYAYARESGENRALVVLNNHATEAYGGEVPVAQAGFADGTVLKDALSDQTVRVEGGKVKVNVASRSGAIYLPQAGVPRATVVTLGVAGAAAVLAGVAAYVVMRRRVK